MRFFGITLALLLSCAASAADWALPSANQGWWTPETAEGTPGTGVPGGFDQYLAGGANDRAVTGNLINVVTAHSADNTGTTDVSTAINAAITAASNGDVIYFPAGTYKITSAVYIPSSKANITIRGTGDSTVFYLSGNVNSSIFVWPDPGYIPQDIQTVTGTKTKGTDTLTVASTSAFTAGQLAWLAYENEVNQTRIEAGAAPVWHPEGYPWMRQQTVRITSKTSSTLTIDPPLPADGTNLATRIYHYGNPSTKVVGWGFEDFTVTFDPSSHPAQAFYVNAAHYNWFHNVKFPDFSRATGSGSCMRMFNSYRSEIRKCTFVIEAGASSDGAIETYANSSVIIADNILMGSWGYAVYESGGSNNCIIAYNYGDASLSVIHGAHPSLILVEGNYGYNHASDGYRGSSSNNTVYANFYYGGGTAGSGWYPLLLHRFKRQYVVARNFLGLDGTNAGRIAWGWPNFNYNADGFAGPTGLSDQVGQTDKSQPGYADDAYVIQAGDVSAGDFWEDWETTGTLTTRTSDTIGVFTVSGGNWFTGDSPTGGGPLYPRVYWDSKNGGIGGFVAATVTGVSGNQVTISFSSGSLPIAGTSVQLYYGPAGWQERDLDVQASSTVTHNYFAAGSGTGSVQNSSGDTFPNSLAWAAKPSWFGSLAWPPFNVDNVATADPERIPAGYRYLNGNEDYLGGGGAANATIQTLNVGTFAFP